MARQRLLILACAAAVMSCALVFTRPSRGTAPTRLQTGQVKKGGAVPEHVAYYFMFRSASDFRKKAVEAGMPQATNRALQKGLSISDRQARVLEEVAATTLRSNDEQDARARVIIEAFRARYPGGVIPQGERLPPPPPELQAMQEERDAIVLRGRDRLRADFGDREFTRIHELAMNRFAAKSLRLEHRR